jgi:hypothetical protein
MPIFAGPSGAAGEPGWYGTVNSLLGKSPMLLPARFGSKNFKGHSVPSVIELLRWSLEQPGHLKHMSLFPVEGSTVKPRKSIFENQQGCQGWPQLGPQFLGFPGLFPGLFPDYQFPET